MNNYKPYLNRLQFFDKTGFDRAFVDFKFRDTEKDDDENIFLLSLLESNEHDFKDNKGDDFELTTIRNAINFTRSWAELGHTLSQQVLTRILFLCFLEPKLINQMALVTDIIRDRKWLFRALYKMIKSKYDIFVKSIKENHQVWDFLIDCLLSDAISKQSDCRVAYSERKHPFLIEAIPLFWPYKSTSYVKMDELVNSVLQFCIDTNSQTSYSIINIFCFAFPENVAKTVKNDLYKLSADALFQLLKLNLIKMPNSDPEHGAILAIKMLPFNPKIALELAESDQKTEGKQIIIEMIRHYNSEDQTFLS